MPRTIMFRAIFTAFALMATVAQPASAEWVADFENLSPTIAYDGPGGGHYENGKNLSGSFSSGGATFLNDYNTDWDSWQGWSYSTTTDIATPGFANQYSAYAPAGVSSSNTYGVGYSSAVIDLQAAPVGMLVTNSTYAALSMISGDAFGKKFGGASGTDPDWFLLTIAGKNAAGNDTGSVPFYLADYRATDKLDDFVIADWTWVDLSSLKADTRQLQFSLSSTDNGEWGMNTPAYFAVDNLTTVPEPGTATLCGIALLMGFAGYSLRRRAQNSNGTPADEFESPRK